MGGFLIELSFGAVFWEPRRFAFWGLGAHLRTRRISPLRRRGGGRSPSGSFPIAPATPSGSHVLTGIVPKRWKVAAALSAAVTTAKQ